MFARSPAEPPIRPAVTGGSNRRRRQRPAILLLAALACLGPIGCSSAPKPERLSPQTMSSTQPPSAENLPGPDPREPPAAGEVSPDAENEPSGSGSPLTVVIEDKARRDTSQLSLVEAAAVERERRAQAGESIAVITDKNLAEFADGQLTEMGTAETPPDSPPVESPSTPPSAPALITEPSEDPEAYWRGRVLRARMNWASAVEEAEHLESKIAELRQRFYAEDDPYYRDSQIKPSWDRALDRLGEAREAIASYRSEVQTILEEGRRASALPGWLREGIDLEPAGGDGSPALGPTPPGEYLPGEPKVAKDPDDRSRR